TDRKSVIALSSGHWRRIRHPDLTHHSDEELFLRDHGVAFEQLELPLAGGELCFGVETPPRVAHDAGLSLDVPLIDRAAIDRGVRDPDVYRNVLTPVRPLLDDEAKTEARPDGRVDRVRLTDQRDLVVRINAMHDSGSCIRCRHIAIRRLGAI